LPPRGRACRVPRRALKKQNIALQAGDAVIINTGWGKLWAKDNAPYVKSCQASA
jgi:kynurenine formamidase